MHIFAILCLGLVLPQDTSKIVSASILAAPAPRAIAELSKQVGVPLIAMPSMKDDVIVIQVKEVRLQDLMDRIASTAHAGWEKDENGYRLVRTDAMRLAERQSDLAKAAEFYRKPLADIRKKYAAQGTFDAKRADSVAERAKSVKERADPAIAGSFDMKSFRELDELEPAGRIMARICGSLTPEELAQIPMGSSVAYSNRPTRMQRPIPEGQAVLEQLKREATLMTAANKRQGPGSSKVIFMGDALYKADEAPTKLILTLNREEGGTAVHASLLITDDEGKRLSGSMLSIGPLANQPEKEALAVVGGSDREEPISLSTTAQAMYATLQSYRSTARLSVPALSDEERQKLLQPDVYDPLSYLASETVLGAAQAKNLNVVGVLPDSMIDWLGFVPGLNRPLVALRALLAARWGGSIRDGWLTISPPDQSSMRPLRVNRSALAAAMASAKKEGRFSLDAGAAYARKNEASNSLMILAFWRSLESRNAVGAGWEWPMLKFYSTLTAAQWQTINNESPVQFRSFTPEQQRLLRGMVYSDGTILSYSGNEKGTYNALAGEPSEGLPNGIPNDGLLEVSVKRDPKGRAKVGFSFRFTRFLTMGGQLVDNG